MSTSDRVLAVANDPALRQEAESVLPALKGDAAPAKGQDLVKIMLPYHEAFHRVQRTDDQWAMYWAVYLEALEGISAAALKEGLKGYVKQPTSDFFPKPGPLLEIATRAQEAINRRWRIATAALAIPAACDDRDEAHNAFSSTFRETAQ